MMNGKNAEEIAVPKETADENGAHTVATAAGEELDKVRSILFGDAYNELRNDYDELSREIERRFAELEKRLGDRLESQIERVRDEASTNYDSLTASINSEGQTLSASLDALDDKLEKAKEENIGALNRLEAAQSGRASDLEARIDKDVNVLRGEQAQVKDDLSNRIDATAASLGDAKTDRKLLAELFEGLASTLRSESN